MKHIKMLGLLAIAAAALMALASTALATSTKANGVKTVSGDDFHAVSEGTIRLDGAIDASCANSTITGFFPANGDTSVTVENLTFTNCGTDTVVPLNHGLLSFNNASPGEVFLDKFEFTVQLHRVIFFIPITTHCIYVFNNTKIGKLTAEGSNATIAVDSEEIPQTATDDACGETATWTGNYKITNPAYFAIH